MCTVTDKRVVDKAGIECVTQDHSSTTAAIRLRNKEAKIVKRNRKNIRVEGTFQIITNFQSSFTVLLFKIFTT